MGAPMTATPRQRLRSCERGHGRMWWWARLRGAGAASSGDEGCTQMEVECAGLILQMCAWHGMHGML